MPLLLLDLDNTVADRDAAFGHWLDARVPDDVGARRFLIDYDDEGRRPRAEFLGAVRRRLGLMESVDELLAEYRALTLLGFPVMDAAAREELVALRARGWRIAIVTNGDGDAQQATVDRIGLRPLLDACVVSATVGMAKPDPRIFALAAQLCDQPLEGGSMIGDAEVDVVGAARAGMRSVWLARGRAWGRDDVHPDTVAADLTAALRGIAASPGST